MPCNLVADRIFDLNLMPGLIFQHFAAKYNALHWASLQRITKSRLRHSISLVIRGAREPTEPSGAGHAGPFACERGSDIHQGIGQGTRVDQKVRDQAWCDSIRKRRSAFRPNAPRIGQTARHRNPTVNCEMDHLAVQIVDRLEVGPLGGTVVIEPDPWPS